MGGAALVATLLAWAPIDSASAQDPGYEPDARFTIGRVKYGGGGDWYADPTSLPNLLRALRERVALEVTDREVNVSLDDEGLHKTPFLYMTGHGAVKLTDTELRNLRGFLEGGGFLWVDDNYGLDEHFRALVARLYPDRSLVELPYDHPIYHVYYEFESGPPKIHEHDGKPPQGFALFHEGRMCLFYTYEADIGDGLENEEVHGDPPQVREQAMQMAVNVVLYSLLH
jgi:hypothetical protein